MRNNFKEDFGDNKKPSSHHIHELFKDMAKILEEGSEYSEEDIEKEEKYCYEGFLQNRELNEQLLSVFYEDFKYIIQELLRMEKEDRNAPLIHYFLRKLNVLVETYSDLNHIGRYLLLKKTPSFKHYVEKTINYTNDCEYVFDLRRCFMNINKKLNCAKLDLTDLEMIEKEINNNCSE